MKNTFRGKEFFHKVAVKFVQAFLPDAKKPYYVRTAVNQELDITGVAAMAERYNIRTKPDVIVEGFNAAMELIFYLVATGVKIRTPLCTIRLRFSGEYDGTETRLPEGVHPEARIQPGLALGKYLEEHVNVEILGRVENDGFIAEVIDDATGLTDESLSVGRLLTIHGNGLKIDSDTNKREQAGVYFIPEKGDPVKVVDIAINEPRTLKVVVPASLKEGKAYRVAIKTQSSAKGSSSLLKNIRDIRSDFTVIARK